VVFLILWKKQTMAKSIVAANWKMNKSLEEGKTLSSEVIEMIDAEGFNDVETVICPPFIHLTQVAHLIKGKEGIYLGAQNCHQNENGAYTGEVSATMIQSCGASFVILGHSERREYFGETDELILLKTQSAFKAGLKVIYCCGEKLDSRETKRHFSVVEKQLSESILKLSSEQIQDVVVAYEPVWAIGTGKTATSGEAQEMHAFIRGKIKETFGAEAANNVSILYGGSVKPENAKEIFQQEDVNGGLIGGASLKSRDFVEIVKAAH
jgi:triosephosphate isomerase